MQYPKRIVAKGETDKKLVKSVQQQLNAKGCGPVDVDGDYGEQTFRAVKLFQTRSTDANGTPLTADGKIGAITWSVLFGADSVPVNSSPASSLLAEALQVAVGQIGVIESPAYSNRGPMVDQYLLATGLNPVGNHYSWCMAYVYWCFNQATAKLNKKNPLVKTAGCLNHWNNATCPKVTKTGAEANPALIKPGFIFIIDHGGGNGHTGIVESVNGGVLTTIEGNTNTDGSANGFGVMRLNKRKIASINKGYLDYSKK